MRANVRIFLITVLLLSLAAPVLADVLLIQQVRARMQRDLPSNGLSQAEVERRYGAPRERRAAVGDPPISRWIYDDYTVYFEYDRVIDSVLNPGAVLSRIQDDRDDRDDRG